MRVEAFFTVCKLSDNALLLQNQHKNPHDTLGYHANIERFLLSGKLCGQNCCIIRSPKECPTLD